MKYSKSAIGLLTAQYRSVLKKCWLINVGLFALGAVAATPANAANNVVVGGTYDSTAGTVTGGTVTDLDAVYDAAGAAADVDAKLGGSFSSSSTVANALDGKQNTISDLDTIRSGAAAGATAVQTTNLADKSLNINAASLKVNDVNVATAGDITTAIADLDANVSQAASTTNPLALTVTQADGVITGVSGSIATDGTTIAVNSEGKLEVNSITAAKVSDFDSQVENDISSSISTSGMALNTALAGKANADLNNLSTAGQTVLTDSANSTISASISSGAIKTALDGKINTSDIATTLSTTSTDSQVASAKAVYDGLATKVNNDGNFTDGTDSALIQGKTVVNAIKDTAAAVDVNAANIAATAALVGTTSAPVTGTTGILAGKTITGATGTDNLNIVNAISYVAANGAGLGTNNVYTGTNTYGSTSDRQVIIDNDGNLTANTSLKVGTSTTNMLTVSSTGTTIGAANAIVGTAGSLDMGGNSLSNVHGLTLTDGTSHTNDATISVDANGINTGNTTLDVGTGSLKSETLYVGTTDQFSVDDSGNISTSGKLDVTGAATVGSLNIGTTGKGFDASGNLTAGTIVATGIDTSAANTVKLGGTGFTTAVTGNMTVSGNTTMTGALDVEGLASLDGGINVNDKFVVATDGKVTLSNGTDNATIEMTNIQDSSGNTIRNVMKVDGTGLYTGYVASESGFTVAQKDAATGLYEETFTVNADGEITGVGLTTDKTSGVDLGVAGTTTDIIGSAINIGGAATTTANLLAGTNGVNVSATGTDITGKFSVATNKFTVASDTGNTAVAGTMDIEGDTTIGDKFSVTAADGSMSAAGGNFTVTSTGATTMKDKLTVTAGGADITGNTTVKGTFGAGANGTEFQVGSTGNVYAQSLAFNSDQTKMVNAIDQGTAITDGDADATARKQTMATAATVAKTIGKLDDKNAHGVTDVSDVASAISSLSQNVETATGGTFTGNVWTGAVDADKDVDYTYSPAATATATAGYHDIMSAVSQVASNVGAATTVAFNNVAAANTVNANIDALNKKVGDMNTIGYGYNNLSNGTTTQPRTVVEALQNIDASMGTIHGLAAKLEAAGTYQGNLAEGTTVEQHLTALDSAIGNRANFEKMHYTQGSKTVVDAIGKLDTKLNSVDHDVRTLRHKFQSGMASAAALSALVPNARAHGNTQLSVGTGMYHGHGAMAVGGFHWFTDNILFNTGIAWDDNEATYRMGVTYSW